LLNKCAKTTRIHQFDIQGVISIRYPLSPYVFRSLFRSHIAREMLTYCHRPVRSCSRPIPCEERALTIRGFPALHRAERDVKFFLENRPLPNPPLYGRERLQPPAPRRGGLQRDGELTTDYHRFSYIDWNMPICTLYIALSPAISRYLAMRQFCAVYLQQKQGLDK